MPGQLRKPINRFLSVACVALSITIAFQLLNPGGQAGETELELDRRNTFELPVYVPVAMNSYTNILEHPLLYESRRLPEPVEVVEEETREPLQLQLAGVAGSGESRIAMFRDVRNNEAIHMLEGMVHRGWTLDRVESSRAIFIHGSDTEELMLEAEGHRNRVARR